MPRPRNLRVLVLAPRPDVRDRIAVEVRHGRSRSPAEMIFSINAKTFRQSVIIIRRDGPVVLRGIFPPRDVTVLVTLEDEESIDISNLQ